MGGGRHSARGDLPCRGLGAHRIDVQNGNRRSRACSAPAVARLMPLPPPVTRATSVEPEHR